MSGNAHQRRKARRAPGPAPAAPQDLAPSIHEDEVPALPVAPPSWEELPTARWIIAGGIAAFALVLAAFVAWLCTLPMTP